MSEIFGQVSQPIPDLVEPIRAYRSWSVSHLGLVGFEDTVWPKGQPLTASCLLHRSRRAYAMNMYDTPVPPHACPSPTSERHGGYGCGIYAYKSLDACMAERWVEGGSAQVFGEVLLWGTVYEHANGYRSQHARVEKIYDLPHKGVLVGPADLAHFYDVELADAATDADTLDVLARQRDDAARAHMPNPGVTFVQTTSATSTSALARADDLATLRRSFVPEQTNRWTLPLGITAAGTSALNAAIFASMQMWPIAAVYALTFLGNAFLTTKVARG